MIELIVTSSMLILIIIGLRFLLRGRISSRLQYALWLLVAIRRLLPFSLFESPASVMNLLSNIPKTVSTTVPFAEDVKDGSTGGTEDAGSTGKAGVAGNTETVGNTGTAENVGAAGSTSVAGSIKAAGNTEAAEKAGAVGNKGAAGSIEAAEKAGIAGDTGVVGNSVAAGSTESIDPQVINSAPSQSSEDFFGSSANTVDGIHWEAVMRFIWFFGFVLSGAFFAASNLRLRRKLWQSRKRIEIPGYPLPVYVTEKLPSPCLYGIIRPAVYVTPGSLCDEKRTAYVTAHELTHYSQMDHIWSFVRVLCLCMYWFNPLVWMAVALSRRDSELACDERTLRRIGTGNRVEYARTLIEMMTEPSKPLDIFCCATTMTNGKGEMKERIKRIAKTPKTLGTALAVTLIVAVAAVAITFGGAAAKISMVLPQSEDVTSIMLEQINEGESLGQVRISKRVDMDAVLRALSDTSKTRRQSVNDAPYQDSYIQIDVEGSNARRFYLYSSYKKDYVEEPYAGIYRINHKMSAVITQLYDPDGQEIESTNGENESANGEIGSVNGEIGSVNGENGAANGENGSANAQKLWEARTPYVGDNSAIGALLGLLPLPQGLSHDHFALLTDGNERGIEWVVKGDETASYERSSFNLNAILLFALVGNLQDFYVTMIDLEQEEQTFHYDRTWAERMADFDVRDYAESPEKLQELLNLFGKEDYFAQYSVAKIEKNGEMADGYDINKKLVMEIVGSYKVKSANWDGVDISMLEESYLIRQFYPESLVTYDYYAYKQKNGTAVLQFGKDGQYSILSPELYAELVNSVKTSSADPWHDNEYTKGVPRPDFENMVWMAPDDENKYCVALYQEINREQIEQYLKKLAEDGWKTTRDLYDKPSLGGIYQKDNHMIRIQFSDDQDVVLYFSIK